MKICSYSEVLCYLDSFIPAKRLLHTGENGILRTKYLLKLLGDPQEKINVIHIAGTSGKGSTAYLISRLLNAHGFKVGFQVSPHLVDLRERFQLNNSLVPKELLVKHLHEITSSIGQAKETQWGKLTFFEVCVCLAFYIFWKENVDYAVMETGLGGLYDATNTVQNPKKLAVITKIGLDHQNVLGRTLSAIAFQKAGIIQKGNTVITVQQKLAVTKVFYSQCKRMKTRCMVVEKKKNFRDIKVSKRSTTFNYSEGNLTLPNLRLGLIGEHQVENAGLALGALQELGKRDGFYLDERKIRLALQTAKFPGRCEIYSTKYHDIIIDGAHNPQKMKAFISTIKKLYPNQKFDFLVAFSKGKDQRFTLRGMLRQIAPVAQKIILTSFRLEGQGDMLHRSISHERIIPILKALNFKNYSIANTTKETLRKYIEKGKRPFVVTGSLYLIGSIYNDLKHAIMHKV